MTNDTVNENILSDVINDVIKILKYGNNKELRLFSQDSVFSLYEIIDYVDMDFLVTLLGLNKLILSRQLVQDKYGRDCQLKYKNGLYVLVPKNIEGSVFTGDDLRVIPYKRTKKLEINGDKIKQFLKGDIGIALEDTGEIRMLKKKIIRRLTQVAR